MAVGDWIQGDWFAPLLSCEWLFKASILTYGFIIILWCQSCTSYTRAYMVPCTRTWEIYALGLSETSSSSLFCVWDFFLSSVLSSVVKLENRWSHYTSSYSHSSSCVICMGPGDNAGQLQVAARGLVICLFINVTSVFWASLNARLWGR